MVIPPSTEIVCLVINFDSSDARYIAILAISSGVPSRPMGCFLYKSDADDELLGGDLGGRRSIKKKTI